MGSRQFNLEKINELIPVEKNIRCLDLGSGTGKCTKYIHSNNPAIREIIALDLSIEMLKNISDKSIIKIQGDSQFIPIKDQSLDLIISRQAFHYFNRPKHVLSECKRLLRKGGYLLIAQIVPFGETDKSWWKTIIRIKQPLRRHRWTKDALVSVIESSGFTFTRMNNAISEESLKSWLERYEHTPKQKAAINKLHYHAPLSYSEIHRFQFIESDIVFNNCRAILLFRLEK